MHGSCEAIVIFDFKIFEGDGARQKELGRGRGNGGALFILPL